MCSSPDERAASFVCFRLNHSGSNNNLLRKDAITTVLSILEHGTPVSPQEFDRNMYQISIYLNCGVCKSQRSYGANGKKKSRLERTFVPDLDNGKRNISS